MEIHVDHISILVYQSVSFTLSLSLSSFVDFHIFTLLCSISSFERFSKDISDDTTLIPWVFLCPLGTCLQSDDGTRSYLVLGPTHDLFHLWINTCSVKSEQTNNEKYLWEYNHQFFMSLMDLFYFPKISVSNDQLAKFHTDLLKPYNYISQGNKK